MGTLIRIVLIGAAGAAFQLKATALTVTTADGNGADTYLSNDSVDGAYVAHGASSSMEFRNIKGTRFRALYFRFDLSGYAGETFSGASLTLNGVNIGRNRALIFTGLLDGTSSGQGENWNEVTLSYAEAAGFLPAAAGAYTLSGDLTAELSRTVGSVNGLNTTVSSKLLDDFLNADTDGLVTFVVYATDPWNETEDFFFETKEAVGNHAPALIFTITEPATLGLIGIY